MQPPRSQPEPSNEPSSELQLDGGAGPLLQRDYWTVLKGCRLSPAEVGELIATRFCELSPPDLCVFTRADEQERALEVGDELRVAIRLAGSFGVRVVHKDANSLTLATLRGHPEAGRITFGAYRNDWGEVVAHIRSLARSSDPLRYAEFLMLGDGMQAGTWTGFLDRLASVAGEGVVGSIVEETTRLHGAPPDESDRPTFEARGD